MNRDKVYFLSDIHLGADGRFSSREREKRVIQFLEEHSDEMAVLYLVGDTFDYWYEYKQVIPNSFSRIIGCLCRLVDEGVQVHLFAGNHDGWLYDFFQSEVGAQVHKDEMETTIYGKDFYIHHGDGIGPGDTGYKFIKTIFRNRIAQWMFSRIHPNLALFIMKTCSSTSRKYQNDLGIVDVEGEAQCIYAESLIKHKSRDYFVFGHRHIVMDHLLSDGRSSLINLGDWLHQETYAVMDSKGELKLMKNKDLGG